MSYSHAASIAERSQDGPTVVHRTTETGATVAEPYSGIRAVLGVALDAHDPGDQFGWVQEWRFAIADVLYFQRGEAVSGLRAYGPDTDSYAYQELSTAAYSVEQLRYAFEILGRFREWLKRAGKGY